MIQPQLCLFYESYIIVLMDSLGSALVLGSCGCLGYHIVGKLVNANDITEITVLDFTVRYYQ